MACDCGQPKGKHLNGCSSGEAKPAKQKRTPRGVKCPGCGAVMTPDSKGNVKCAFTSSHAQIKRNRAASATAQGVAQRRNPGVSKTRNRFDLKAANQARKTANKEAKQQRKEGR